MRNLLLVVLLAGLISPLMAQEREVLDEVVVKAVNYKYLSAVDNSEAPIPIWNAEKEAATFDVTNSDVYLDEFNMYHVVFRIPHGVMVVAYDQDGKILRTIERFKNYQMPREVRLALKERYPTWTVVKDLFLVTYTDEKGAKKMYKVKLKNNKEVLRVKLDDEGNFI